MNKEKNRCGICRNLKSVQLSTVGYCNGLKSVVITLPSHLRQLVTVMILLHEIFFVHRIVGKLFFCSIPFQLFAAAVSDVAHLRHRGYMSAGLYRAMQILHFS
jgi:hypothetical protein